MALKYKPKQQGSSVTINNIELWIVPDVNHY